MAAIGTSLRVVLAAIMAIGGGLICCCATGHAADEPAPIQVAVAPAEEPTSCCETDSATAPVDAPAPHKDPHRPCGCTDAMRAATAGDRITPAPPAPAVGPGPLMLALLPALGGADSLEFVPLSDGPSPVAGVGCAPSLLSLHCKLTA